MSAWGLRAWHTHLAAWLIALACVAGCGEDDSDHIDRFVADVTGEVSEERVEHVLSRYVDLTAEPLAVRVFADDKLYRAEDRAALEEAVRRSSARLRGQSLRILRKHVELEGDRARVELQLLGSDVSGRVDYRLRKRDQRWLLTQAYIGR